jgi:alpha-ribazole phosphatase
VAFSVAHGAWSELELHADFATLRVLNSQARWQKEEEFRADH